MRRNIDLSQEKGIKYEYFTFKINQANKKEEVIDLKHERQKKKSPLPEFSAAFTISTLVFMVICT